MLRYNHFFPCSPGPRRSRILSIGGLDTDIASPLEDGILDEAELDYTEIASIRPLPLFTLIEAEFERPPERSPSKTGRNSAIESDKDEYSGLFDSSSRPQVEENLDDILNQSVFDFNATTGQKAETDSLGATSGFGARHVRLLTKLLTHSHLPGLSSLDQMHLLALADAVASFNASYDQSHKSDGGTITNDQAVAADALDDCGLRYLLTMRQHTYLLRCVPIAQRRQLHKEGLSTSCIVWAFHSEAQEELVQLIVAQHKNNLKWSTLRELGVGWWIRNNATLRRLLEIVGKCAFQQKNDPLDAAVFYLAMKKKQLVWGLYRSVNVRDCRLRNCSLTYTHCISRKRR